MEDTLAGCRGVEGAGGSERLPWSVARLRRRPIILLAVVCLGNARRDDVRLLWELLFEAAFWRPDVTRPPLEEALEDPELARYVEGFGRPGDFGVVAEDATEWVGAAWWRLFRSDAPGYGFIDEATPEVSVAVLPGLRGQGIGTALLKALTGEARDVAIERLSLSVARDNPAVSLYERLGFRSLSSQGSATKMVIDLQRPQTGSH